jgi:hypothetical protein
MTDWKSPGESRDRTKLALIIGSGVIFLVVAWLVLARPSEENLSSSGFNSGGSFPVAPLSGAAFSRHSSQTGLSFVRIGEAAPPSAGLAENGATAPASGASGQATSPLTAPPGASPAPAAETDKSILDRIKALGVPTDDSKLKGLLTGPPRMLSGLIAKVVGYPPAVKFLLNNKTLNDLLFSMEPGKTNCQSSKALTKAMSNPAITGEGVFIVKVLMAHPEAAEVAVNSDYTTRLMACPSVEALNKNPAGLASVVLANPELLGVVADPAAVSALQSNPQASAMMSTAQAALGVGGPSQ